jgi:uncharacterized membrane protein (DUF2068 family)
MGAPRSPVGLRVIVGYKLAKAVAGLALGVTLLALGPDRAGDALEALASSVRRHAVQAWSLALGRLLARAAAEEAMGVVAVAALLDGCFSAFEAWALHLRLWWSPWLIIVSTSALLPVEVVALVRNPGAGRVGLLVVNAAIVGYLAWRRATVVKAPR